MEFTPSTEGSEAQSQVLGRAAGLLATATDFRQTLRNTISACLPALGDFGFFDVIQGDQVIRTVVAHEDPAMEALLAPTQWVKQARDDMNLCALSTGSAALHSGITDSWYRRVAANDQHLDLLRRVAFCSMITVPVRYRDELVGALTLFMGRSRRNHLPQDVLFASEIASLAAPVVVNARLVEQHRQSEDALRRSQRRLEILATAGEALSRSLDPEETLRAIGDATVPAIADWCRIDLLDEQGVSQRRLAHHMDPQLAARALALARQMQASTRTRGSIAWVMRTGESHYGHFEEAEAQADDALRSFTGEFGMRAHYIIPLVARGRTIGAMAIIQAESGRDLTPEDRSLILELGRRAALALDNARLYSAANAANLAKDEFLAMLGHELRNPLAPISTALELMARNEPNAHLQERRIIGRQVAHLSRLIDDLLDISRITRGKVQLLREPVDMKEVVANAVEATRPLFEKRRHPLQITIMPQPATVAGDAVRLVQVLGNLLTNAAKFTSAEDRVSLTLSSTADERVEVTVQDTGAGIDAQLLPRVFDLFVQGQQGSDRSGGGLGLGLAIVRSLVEMHGGEVTARSDGPGRGSSFTARLPVSLEQPPQARAPTSPPIAAVRGARVLIVDDNVDAAETLSELLRVSGYEPRCAHRADEAMGMVGEFRPKVALLDIGLPQVDGYELAQMLRSSELGADIRLVALTGYGRENDKARALDAGFDEHLVKPASIDKLLDLLQRLVSSPVSP